MLSPSDTRSPLAGWNGRVLNFSGGVESVEEVGSPVSTVEHTPRGSPTAPSGFLLQPSTIDRFWGLINFKTCGESTVFTSTNAQEVRLGSVSMAHQWPTVIEQFFDRARSPSKPSDFGCFGNAHSLMTADHETVR